MDRQQEIAETILFQIRSADPYALMAYAATNAQPCSKDESYAGGIEFNVNGFNHKGKVKVMLTWMDTYEVHFCDDAGKSVKTVQDVYFDELVKTLDYIEQGVQEYLDKTGELPIGHKDDQGNESKL